jgi:hypothetical protein
MVLVPPAPEEEEDAEAGAHPDAEAQSTIPADALADGGPEAAGSLEGPAGS